MMNEVGSSMSTLGIMATSFIFTWMMNIIHFSFTFIVKMIAPSHSNDNSTCTSKTMMVMMNNNNQKRLSVVDKKKLKQLSISTMVLTRMTPLTTQEREENLKKIKKTTPIVLSSLPPVTLFNRKRHEDEDNVMVKPSAILKARKQMEIPIIRVATDVKNLTTTTTTTAAAAPIVVFDSPKVAKIELVPIPQGGLSVLQTTNKTQGVKSEVSPQKLRLPSQFSASNTVKDAPPFSQVAPVSKKPALPSQVALKPPVSQVAPVSEKPALPSQVVLKPVTAQKPMPIIATIPTIKATNKNPSESSNKVMDDIKPKTKPVVVVVPVAVISKPEEKPVSQDPLVVSPKPQDDPQLITTPPRFGVSLRKVIRPEPSISPADKKKQESLEVEDLTPVVEEEFFPEDELLEEEDGDVCIKAATVSDTNERIKRELSLVRKYTTERNSVTKEKMKSKVGDMCPVCVKCGQMLAKGQEVVVVGLEKSHKYCPTEEELALLDYPCRYFVKRVPDRLVCTFICDKVTKFTHTFIFDLDQKSQKEALLLGIDEPCKILLKPDVTAKDVSGKRRLRPPTTDDCRYFDCNLRQLKGFGKLDDYWNPSKNELTVRQIMTRNGVTQIFTLELFYDEVSQIVEALSASINIKRASD